MRTFIFAIAFTLSAVATVNGQAVYSVTDLGHLDDGFGTYALAVNNQGHVVGMAADSGGRYLAFLYAGGPLQSLGSLGGGFSRANSINSSDRIVGRSKTVADDTHAFLYDAAQANPAMLDLHNVLGFGGSFSSAISVNDAGQIVGVATVPDGNRHAFLLTGNTATDLHSLVSFGGLNSTAYSISNTGWIAGVSDDANGNARAFLYNLNTSTLTDLGTLGGVESTAWAVNASGKVVGEASANNDGSTTYAFQTAQPNPINQANSLGALGGTYSTALGINVSGQIVGGAEDAEASGHAFLYTAAAGMQDLETLIPADSGWFFASATAINDSGYIVGYGVHDGESAAFLLTPNAPPTLGTYQDKSVALSGDTTVVPNGAPTSTTSMSVYTSTDFKGKLEADPSTGNVRVTNAHPAGTYAVTVKAFNGSNGPAATKTFTLTVTTPQTCNPVSFATTTFDVGDRAGAVLVGDFNGDGKQDLAVAAVTTNWSPRTLILLGDGAGHFNFLSEIPIGARAVADFNGDGKQDLAALDSSNALVYLGDGTGHFVASNNFDTGCTAPFQLAVGDFNGDGKLDLATACYSANSVTILSGNGAGGFGQPSSFTVSDGPQGLAVGDFNGDDKQDVAAACMPAGIVSILSGDGAGGFAAATNFNAGLTPRDIEVGDFNGDGEQDLAVSNPDANAASVMLGNGAGGFGAPASFAVGSNPSTEIAVGDFDGDGKQDLAVPNFASSNVSLLLGNGAGSFGPATNFSVGLSPFGVAVGDFNGDGMQDLATPNWDSNNVSILLRGCNTPTGTNVLVQPVDSTTGNPAPVTLNFSQVTGAGTTAVTSSSDNPGPPLPARFKAGDPATYYDITTTAQFTPPVTVCVRYADAAYQVSEENIKLLHFDGTAWEDITTSVDVQTNTVCGVTSSFSPFVVAEEDVQPPQFSAPGPVAVTATSSAGAAVSYITPTAEDDFDGTVPVNCSPPSGGTFALGPTSVQCTATDSAGNTTQKSFSVTVTYAWSGVLQPINADGKSVFKLGSTVPVKFSLTGASAGVANATARLYYAKINYNVVGSGMKATSTSSGSTGNLFRYDPTTGQYIFNWRTKGLTPGTYQLKVDLGDGVAHTITVSLK